jgi:hypothetical protein
MGRRHVEKGCARCGTIKRRTDFVRAQWEAPDARACKACQGLDLLPLDLSAEAFSSDLRDLRDLQDLHDLNDLNDLNEFDLDEILLDNKSRRNLRAKRRRTRVNSLLASIAEHLELDAKTDHVDILERAYLALQASKLGKLAAGSATKPIVSLPDICADALLAGPKVTHSPVA